MSSRSSLLTVIALVVGTSAAFAQKSNVPARPKLTESADTNDALAYLQFGNSMLQRDPGKAADALYWATRINPGLADALYTRRVALLLKNGNHLDAYMRGNRKALQSKEIRQLDSLLYRALMINPFLYRRHDRLLFEEYMTSEFKRETGAYGSVNEFSYWLETYMSRADAGTRAWSAYNRGQFADAVRWYAEAIKSARKSDKYLYQADRARTHFMLGLPDSAEAGLKLALQYLREQDEKNLIYFYESKALYEHSIGLTYEVRGDRAAAREAYGRALQEDMTYYAAQQGASRVALAAGDTAAAISALDLAVQIKPNDPLMLADYAELLMKTGRLDEAEKHLLTAIEIEPYYAESYFLLGQVYTAAKRPTDAAAQFREYLARAARNDPRRKQIPAQISGQ